jgi:dihydrofolate synthase / folylpolyglutamate synthase
MTYDEAIAYWYGRVDFERRSPKPGDMKLDRMRAVLRLLGDPHKRLRIVHVAGSKGKGSTSAILASVLGAAGYRVGLFTSPHLNDVRERVQVDGIPISRVELAARIGEIAAAVRPLEQSKDTLRVPTFFEIGTALGFLHFDCRQVNVAVVEVGLGGRFDSTNVCQPLVSVITNISFDHMALLGDRLSLIAREKAGIIKRGRPVVCSAESAEANDVIRTIAAERKAPLKILGRDFTYDYEPAKNRRAVEAPGPMFPRVRVTTARNWPWMGLGLHGRHQAANAAGVVAIVEELREQGMAIGDTSVARGLAQVLWPARLEVVGADPLIVLDCAHNVASAQALVDTLDDSFMTGGTKHLIFAVSSDKQVLEMIKVLGPRFNHFHLTRFGNNPRCMPPEQVAAILLEIVPGACISIHGNAVEALQQARASSSKSGLIAIAGSVFLAGELRPHLVVA